jgi:acetyl-CoA carboxylase biotin carboxyl carrier protein
LAAADKGILMTETTGAGGMQVDTALVRQLAELLDETRLSEIEVQDGERRIRVVRAVASAAVTHLAPSIVSHSAAPAAAPPAATAADDLASDPGLVRSPMVGTVYLASEPGADPFVSEGVQVKAGDTLLIVEAMKVMNPIAAPRGGTVKRLLVENGQPIEFDQPLAIID